MPLFLVVIVLLYAGAWMLQSHLLLHQDVLSFVHWGERLLEGGSYTKDYFETNPPLIFYLSIPPLLFAKYFAINLITAVRLYVMTLITFSLLLCYIFTKHIFDKSDSLYRYGFVVSLTVILLVIPLPAFGQREHLLIIFSMPYILLMAARLDNSRISSNLATSAGTLAGFGFALKPFFLIVPIIIEGYYFCRARRLGSLIRPETIAMFCCMAIYLVMAILLHPDYFNSIIPFLFRNYYASIAGPTLLVVLNPPIMMSYLAILYFISAVETIKYRSLGIMLALALLGLIVAYFCGRTTWFYHVLPAYSLGLLLFSFLTFGYFNGQSISRKGMLNQGAYSILLVAAIAFICKVFYTEKMYQLNSFSFFLYYSVSLYFFIFVGIYVMHEKVRASRLVHAPSVILASIFLFIPALMQLCLYHENSMLKSNSTVLVRYLAQHAEGKPVYFITTNSVSIFPNLDRLSIKSASRFPFLWMVPGFLNRAQMTGDQQQLEEDKNFLANMISEDLDTKKPSMVFVDCSQLKVGMEDHTLDYLAYFKNNASFERAWKHYRYLTTLTIDAIVKSRPAVTYKVYERYSTSAKS